MNLKRKYSKFPRPKELANYYKFLKTQKSPNKKTLEDVYININKSDYLRWAFVEENGICYEIKKISKT